MGAVGFGGETHYLGEEAGEVELVFETELEADLVELHWGGVEQFAGFADFHQVEIGDGAVTCALLEHSRHE